MILTVEIEFLIGFVLALLSGILIGAEREARGKDAGISTHSLVIIGSMLFTFLSMKADPASTSRIASQIVSGIGFLGAGIIMKEGKQVKNLTTAASLWFAGAIGMAFGFGYYFIGILAAVASTLIPRIPHFHKESPESESYKN
ncbi:MAG: MgtC/SapB family protein [Nanoarchaeota archaeon]|nr:MgtC/SapB family protein [Nanoarchaeota archaeon]